MNGSLLQGTAAAEAFAARLLCIPYLIIPVIPSWNIFILFGNFQKSHKFAMLTP